MASPSCGWIVASRASPESGGSREDIAGRAGKPAKYTRSLARRPSAASAERCRLGQLAARTPGLRPVEGHPAVPQRHVRVVADDQVVEQRDVEEPAGGERLGRQVEVVRGWRRVARGVVVDEDDARGVEPDRVPEELADAHQRRADVALVDGRDPQDVRSSCRAARPAAPRARAGPSGGSAGRPRRAGPRIVQRAAGQSAMSRRPSSKAATSCAARAGADAGHGRRSSSSAGPGQAGQAVVARRGRRAARSTADRPRVPDPQTSAISSAAVRPPTPREGQPLAWPFGQREARGSPDRPVPARSSRPGPCHLRHPMPGRGIPGARATEARRFLPPSGPRGHDRAYGAALIGGSSGRALGLIERGSLMGRDGRVSVAL